MPGPRPDAAARGHGKSARTGFTSRPPSCAFTLVISNIGACTLLVPLGTSVAQQTGIDPRVAAIVVGIGVFNSFILPTHPVNALHMGLGEYRFVAYVKIGGGLSPIYIVVRVAVTYLLYL